MYAVAVMSLLGLLLGYLLGVAARRFRLEKDPRIEAVEGLLPGSQCGQCGYPGCGQAAVALVEGRAAVTLCPPGGKRVAEALAQALGASVDLSGMDDDPRVARVEDSLCIGCIKCLRVCPTDAIVGAPKQIHVVMQRACIGCGACVEICPTGSMRLVEMAPTLRSWRWRRPETAAAR